MPFINLSLNAVQMCTLYSLLFTVACEVSRLMANNNNNNTFICCNIGITKSYKYYCITNTFPHVNRIYEGIIIIT